MFELLQHRGGEVLMQLTSLLLLGGVGLATLSTSWPTFVVQLLPCRLTRRVGGASVAVLSVVLTTTVGVGMTPIWLSAFYLNSERS